MGQKYKEQATGGDQPDGARQPAVATMPFPSREAHEETCCVPDARLNHVTQACETLFRDVMEWEVLG